MPIEVITRSGYEFFVSDNCDIKTTYYGHALKTEQGDHVLYWLIVVLDDLKKNMDKSEYFKDIHETADTFELDLYDKKYHVVGHANGYLECLRYGESWRMLTEQPIVALITDISNIYEVTMGGKKL